MVFKVIYEDFRIYYDDSSSIGDFGYKADFASLLKYKPQTCLDLALICR